MPWRAIVTAWLVTRLGLLAIGVTALAVDGENPSELAQNYQFSRAPFSRPLEIWVRYDAEWYLTIATRGYQPLTSGHFDMRPGFMPLYPALVAAATALVRDPVVAGLLVANAMLVAFLALLYRLVDDEFGDAAAMRAVWLYLLFPTSFFLSAPYSESTLLAAIAASFVAARRRRWGLAALGSAAAVVARPLGVVAAVATVAEWTWQRLRAPEPPPFDRIRVGHLLVLVVAPALALLVYLAHARATFGDPLAIFPVQTLYRGAAEAPWLVFAPIFSDGPAIFGYANGVLDAAIAVGFVALVPATFVMLGPSLGLLAAGMVLPPLVTSLVAYSRMALAAVPCFIVLALWLEARPWRLLVYALLAVLQAIAFARFATWNWVA